jgi:hypothetical protein
MLEGFEIIPINISAEEKIISKKKDAFSIYISGYHWLADVFLSSDDMFYFTIDGHTYHKGGESEITLIFGIMTLVKSKRIVYEALDNQLNLLYSKYNGGTG